MVLGLEIDQHKRGVLQSLGSKTQCNEWGHDRQRSPCSMSPRMKLSRAKNPSDFVGNSCIELGGDLTSSQPLHGCGEGK